MLPFEAEKSDARDRREWILPLLFGALSAILLVLPSPLQQRIASGLRASILAPFILTQEELLSVRVRAEEASELRVRLDSVVTTLVEENERLRALLGLRTQAGAGALAASAIRTGTLGSESMFLLDVGTADGVFLHDPVIVADGLIGVVREVFTASAVVMDWTHPEFGVSVMTEDGEAFGFIESRQGAFREEDRLILNGVPFYTPVEEGERLVTTGRGSVYPRGIPVGTVSALAEAEAGWRKSFWVEPAARPGTATHVLVLIESGPGTDRPLDSLWLPEAPVLPSDLVPEGVPSGVPLQAAP